MYVHSNCTRLIRRPVVNYCSCHCSNKSDSKSQSTVNDAESSENVPQKYNSKNVTADDMRWRTPTHVKEAEYYKFLRVFYKEDSNRNLLQKLQTPFDLSPSAIKKWFARKTEQTEIMTQSYVPERNQVLGNELAAAHFVVHRGGAVKFHNEDKWIKANNANEYSLPIFYDETKVLEGIDCTNVNLHYEGLVNLRDLKQVEWLSLNGCKNMDDWCLDVITNIFSHSLIYLDLRNCPNITFKGVGSLHQLKHLRILYLDDFYRSTIYEYTCSLLEELMPNLEIKSDPVKFDI